MQSSVTSAVPTAVQWRMVLILCLVNAVAFIDRNVLPLLVQPIKRDLSITDTEMSFHRRRVRSAILLHNTIGRFTGRQDLPA